MDTYANGVEQRPTLWITLLNAVKEGKTMRIIS
jgi:hypothetical protein